MHRIKTLLLTTGAAVALSLIPTPAAKAQVTVTFGAEPSCPYGYYDYAPYNCVPDGYYGEEWFTAGVFNGVGPWFHGPKDFQGKVDNHYDPQHGYSGDMPKRGDKPSATRKSPGDFKGNESRDGRGHTATEKH